MRISIETIATNDEPDDLTMFLERADGSTIFHRPRFLSYHTERTLPREKYSPFHLLARDEDRIVGFLPGILERTDAGAVYSSHRGASCGGWALESSLAFRHIDAIVEKSLEVIAARAGSVEITIAADCYTKSLGKGDAVRFSLLRRGFLPAKSDLLLIADHRRWKEIEEALDSNARSELNVARRNNLSFRPIPVDEILYDLLLTSQKRFGSTPTHTLEELKAIESLIPGSIIGFGVFHEDLLVSGGIGIRAGREILNTFYVFDSEESRAMKTSYRLYLGFLEWTRDNQIRYVDFGPSTFGYEPNFPLIFFKEKFGGLPQIRTKFRKVEK